MSDSSSDSEISIAGYLDRCEFDCECKSSKVEPFEWGALPLELRAMCVRKMNFKTSMKLRCASRLDKLIVESPLNRPKYDRLILSYLFHKTYVWVQIGEEQYEMNEEMGGENDQKKVESLILSLLKCSHIKNLKLGGFEGKDATKLFDKMAAVGAVIPQLSLDNLCEGNFHLALEHFGECVDLFDFVFPSTRCLERVLRDSLLIPKLINAKHIQVVEYSRVPVNTFIQHWLQYDKELGSKLIVYLGSFEKEEDGEFDPEETEKPTFASFVETFADRIVYYNEDEKVVRINTDNPNKQILMRVIRDIETFERFDDQFVTVNMVCQVIPMTLKKEDYETTSGRVEGLE